MHILAAVYTSNRLFCVMCTLLPSEYFVLSSVTFVFVGCCVIYFVFTLENSCINCMLIQCVAYIVSSVYCYFTTNIYFLLPYW